MESKRPWFAVPLIVMGSAITVSFVSATIIGCRIALRQQSINEQIAYMEAALPIEEEFE